MRIARRYEKSRLLDKNNNLSRAVLPVFVNIINHKKRGWGSQHKYLVGHTNYSLFYDKIDSGVGARIWHDQQVITGMFTARLFKTRKNVLNLLVDIAQYCKQQGIRNVYVQITPLIAQGFSPEYAHLVFTSIFIDKGIKLKVFN